MKRILQALLLSLLSIGSFAQSVFWSDNFDAPSGGIINNNAGVGWSPSTNTPGGGPNTSFLGFNNSWLIGNASGACSSGNKVYIRSLGPGNVYLSDVFTDKLISSPSISTVGQSNMFLAFIWRCDGVPGSDYGQVGLSSDNGATWVWLAQEYSGQETCTSQNIAIPEEYEGITSFKFAFRFISNATSCSTCDPPFNIDNIQLLGESFGCDNPIVDAGANVDFCFGSAPVNIGGSPSASGGSGDFTYDWSPSAGLSDANSPNPTASPNSTTTYTLTVTDVNTGCSAQDQVTVQVLIPQNLTISLSGSTNICPGEILSLAAAPGFTNYVWTTPSGIVNGAEIQVQESGQYSAQALGANGCLSTSTTLNLTLLQPIPLEITSEDGFSFCEGSTITLNASAGFTGLIWSTPTVVIPGNSIQASQPGIYSVSGVDANGCTTLSENVIVSENTPISLTTSPAGEISTCVGNAIEITADAGFTNYIWTSPDGTLNSNSISASSEGAYFVSAEDVNGCLSTSEVVNLSLDDEVIIPLSPSGDVSICPSQTLVITAGSGFENYTWNGELGNSTFTITEAGTYSVSASTQNGCPASSEEITVTEFTQSTLNTNPEGNVSFCSGESIGLSADNSFTNLIWSTPEGSIAGLSITASEPGIYSVSGDDINGCQATSEVINVSENTPIPLNTSPEGEITTCVGNSIEISAEPGFTNYVWTSPDGLVSGSSITAITEGIYSVSAEDINGCNSTSEEINLSIAEEVTIPLSPSGEVSICPSQPLVLTAGAGFQNYVWNGQAGNSTLIVTEPGTYSVSASTPNGCPAFSEEIVVSVFDVSPLTTSPNGDIFICQGASVSISADEGFTDYSWSTPQGVSSSISIDATAQGTYSVTAIDLNGCASTSSPINLSFFIAQEIQTTPSGLANFCEGDELTLSANDGFTDYIWTSETLTGSGSTISIAQEGTYTVTGLDENGCQATSEPIIIEQINPSPLNVTPPGPILRCENLSVTLVASAGFTDYVWSPGNVQGVSYTLIDAGDYSVTAISPEGCSVTSNTVSFGFYPTPTLIGVNPPGPVTICQGESVVLSADTGYTQYLWNTNATGRITEVDESDFYIVTANDSNNCAANSASVQVIVDPVFTIETTPSGEVSICDDGEVTIIAEEGLSNYQWSNLETGQEITIDQEGAYSISAINENGCSGSSEAILVSFLDTPTASFSYEQTTGYNVAFDNTSTNGESYLWTFPGGDTSEEQNPIFDFLFDNSWPVSLVVCNDCGCDTLDTFVEVIKTSIYDISNSDIQLTHQNKTLVLSNLTDKPHSYKLLVFNAHGQLIFRDESVLFSSQAIDLGSVSSGMYIIQLLTEQGVLRRKILISP